MSVSAWVSVCVYPLTEELYIGEIVSIWIFNVVSMPLNNAQQEKSVIQIKTLWQS